MRRGLLIALTFTVLLSAVPVSADQPSDWQGIISDWWRPLYSLFVGAEVATTGIANTSDKNLPYLDPNGTEVVDQPDDQTSTTVTAASEDDDDNSLPYLDPNG